MYDIFKHEWTFCTQHPARLKQTVYLQTPSSVHLSYIQTNLSIRVKRLPFRGGDLDNELEWMLTSSRSPLACFPLKEFGAVAVAAAAKAHLGSKKKKLS